MEEISLVVSNSWKAFLGEATETYHQDLMANPESDAVHYLTKVRGLSKASVQYFKIGIVENPLAGHEMYRGRIALPYLTRSGVISLRFRAADDETQPKYLSMPGDIKRMFNTIDLDRREDFVCITEGEIDALTAHQCGLPAVGIPGVSGWNDYYPRCFKGYAHVYILADNDDKGQGGNFAEKVASQVPNSRIVLMPAGHDVNSYVREAGPDALVSRLEAK